MAELTYEYILSLFAETDKKFQYAEKLIEDQSRSFKETERLLKERFEDTDRQIKGVIVETDRQIKEGFAETERQIKDGAKEYDRRSAEVNKKIAELGDTIGRFAEEQIKTDLVNKFDNWGIPVKSYSTHTVKRDPEGNFAYEVDIVIYNTDYIIAIEVKHQLKTDHVDLHLERMKKLQEFPLPETKGKILLAGVVAMIIGEGVDTYAESKGLFVIKPSGDSVKIANNRKTFKPQEWKVSL